jgi:Cys-tRNA(Pro)/Cys-tRNA(Cys) deacylase
MVVHRNQMNLTMNNLKTQTTEPPPVSVALSQKGILHEVFRHPGPLRSLEQAAEERSQRPEQIVRSILFRVSKGDYLMVLMAGPEQIDWKTLRKHVGSNRLTMASKEEVFSVTGYPLGAVAPFGLPHPIKILVDNSVFQEEIVSMGSGIRGVAIILKSADLIRALGEYESGNFGTP